MNIMETLIKFFKKVKMYLKKIWRRIKEYHHFIVVRKRLIRIRMATDKTMGDKLRTIAAKIDAIEKYGDKYCNPDNAGRLDAHYNKKYYNKLKNEVKKELLILMYNY